MRQSRCKNRIAFKHNSVQDLTTRLEDLFAQQNHQGELLRQGKADVFVAVEALYSMDGDLAPLPSLVEAMEAVAPMGNCNLIVDEVGSQSWISSFGMSL